MKIAALRLACSGDAKRQDWPRAADCFQTLLDVPFFLPELFTSPVVYGVYMEAGLSFFMSGNPEKALVPWRQASALHPDHTLPHFNIATALMQQGQVYLAIPHYQAAVQIEPDNTDFTEALARAYAQQDGSGDGQAYPPSPP